MNPPGSAHRPANGAMPRSISSTLSAPSRIVKITTSTVTSTGLGCGPEASGMRERRRDEGPARHGGGDDEGRAVLGGGDARDGACVEVQEVAFHAVAEDDAARGHKRFQEQRLAGCYPAGHRIRPGMTALERF